MIDPLVKGVCTAILETVGLLSASTHIYIIVLSVLVHYAAILYRSHCCMH